MDQQWPWYVVVPNEIERLNGIYRKMSALRFARKHCPHTFTGSDSIYINNINWCNSRIIVWTKSSAEDRGENDYSEL